MIEAVWNMWLAAMILCLVPAYVIVSECQRTQRLRWLTLVPVAWLAYLIYMLSRPGAPGAQLIFVPSFHLRIMEYVVFQETPKIVFVLSIAAILVLFTRMRTQTHWMNKGLLALCCIDFCLMAAVCATFGGGTRVRRAVVMGNEASSARHGAATAPAMTR